MDLDTVADELYAAAPGDFIATRDARVTAAREAGDKELADAVRALRRPTTSAWLVNVLARERADLLTDLLDLGTELREAQAQLAGDDLRRLSRERQRAIAGLVGELHELASAAGQDVSEAVGREVEGTLLAAVADQNAGEAVRSGRLTGALHYSGFGSVDVSDAVATPLSRRSTPPTSRRRASTVEPAAGAATDTGAEERRRAAAEQALAEAVAAAEEADATATEHAAALTAARDRQEAVRTEIGELEQRLETLRTEQTALAREVRTAQRASESAARAARSTDARVSQAKAALDKLDKSGKAD